MYHEVKITERALALCYVADSVKPYEVLINGVKRGVSPKHRHLPKFR